MQESSSSEEEEEEDPNHRKGSIEDHPPDESLSAQTLDLRREKQMPDPEKEKHDQNFKKDKFVTSTRCSNLMRFESMKNSRQLGRFIESFWEMDLKERLDVVDNLDSIITLVDENELSVLISTLYGNTDDFLSKAVIANFYKEIKEEMLDKSQFKFASETLYDSNENLNFFKLFPKRTSKKEIHIRFLSKFNKFILSEDKLRKKLLRLYPIVLQKIQRVRNIIARRNSSLLQSQYPDMHHSNNDSRRASTNKTLKHSSKMNLYFEINEDQSSRDDPSRMSQCSFTDSTQLNMPKITLCRLSKNQKNPLENLRFLESRHSIISGYSDSTRSGPSVFVKEADLLGILVEFGIRRYREHLQIENVVLCFEAIKQVLGFCPDAVFHQVGLDTIIRLIHNHIKTDKRVGHIWKLYSQRKSSIL